MTLLSFLALKSVLFLPVYTAYPLGDLSGLSLEDGGKLSGWASPHTRMEWGGYFGKAGDVHVSATIRLPAGETASYRLIFGNVHREARLAGDAVDFGLIHLSHPAWIKIYLAGLKKSGSSFGDLQGLGLEGEPAASAKFNLVSRRNAASVHLGYPIAQSDHAEWFYNEVTALEDPVDTYYMACGFRRGYFGMQVNSLTERRVIFSIWDSGKEAIERSKVKPEDQVQLLGKGEGVFASGFGNEGTGGHSHWVYPWKTGVTQKFLVGALPTGSQTRYTAYFWLPESGKWKLIASFLAPHDGTYLSGLYSFVEDFNGDNGNLKRKALYGPSWIRTQEGEWKRLLTAKFSHDVTGGKDRFDYDFGLENGRFFLQNGGFEGRSPAYGETVKLSNVKSDPPQIDFAGLPKD